MRRTGPLAMIFALLCGKSIMGSPRDVLRAFLTLRMGARGLLPSIMP